MAEFPNDDRDVIIAARYEGDMRGWLPAGAVGLYVAELKHQIAELKVEKALLLRELESLR